MKKLIIIGAGGYGLLVRELAVSKGYENIIFLDDNSKLASGKISDVQRFADYENFVIAIGNPTVRKKLAMEIEKILKPVNIIANTAVISASADIGHGCIVEHNVVVNSNAKIKDYVIVNAGAVVNHDASVGEFCQIDCNAVVASGKNVECMYKVKSSLL